MDESNNRNPEFDGKDERSKLKQEFHKEHGRKQDEVSKTSDQLSMGDSIRSYGGASGDTFGSGSNVSRFSNIGEKDRHSKGDENITDRSINNADRENGNGSTGYSDYLNQAQNDFINDRFDEGNNGKENKE